MFMYKEISLNEFIDSFKRFERDNFSYEGYEVLYNHLIEVSGSDGYQLDVVGLDCEWNEAPAEEVLEEYEGLFNDIQEIQYQTTAFELSNGNILYIVF